MGKTSRLTTEQFIERAKKVHGDKYDYSKVNYINKTTKVIIICPIHGEFEKYPLDFLKGQGCQKCSIEKRCKNRSLTKDQFIFKAREIHGDKYDYSKVNYINSITKVCIICPTHGEFWQTPSVHLNGNGCSKCSNHYQYTIEEWIDRFKKVHGDRYDYSILLKNGFNGDNFDVMCNRHGVFTTSKHNHLIGQGCPKCGIEFRAKKKTLTTEQFIQKAKELHGDKYDYSKVKYIDSRTKVCIICPKHGEFWQVPYYHLQGNGCPKCKESNLEKNMSRFLIEKKISFDYQKKFSWLGKQSLDFYLPKYNIAIECQGEQHFIGWGKDKNRLKKQITLDEKKYEKCNNHNIKILYFGKKENTTDISYIYKNNFFTDEKHLFKIMEN